VDVKVNVVFTSKRKNRGAIASGRETCWFCKEKEGIAGCDQQKAKKAELSHKKAPVRQEKAAAEHTRQTTKRIEKAGPEKEIGEILHLGISTR